MAGTVSFCEMKMGHCSHQARQRDVFGQDEEGKHIEREKDGSVSFTFRLEK